MNAFKLCSALDEKLFVTDLSLSRVLLNPTKDLPWIFLVPRVENVLQITDLSMPDQMKLLKELNLASKIMTTLFECDRLNIAAIGNKTPQLHVHIICRTMSDPYWPETVWQYEYTKMTESESLKRVTLLRSKFESANIN